MKRLLRLAAATLLATLLLVSSIAFAYASTGRTLEVNFLPGVKFVVNGQQLAAGNDQGMYVEGNNRYPNHLVYNGTVYVPLRFVEEVSNKYAFWHPESKTVLMWDKTAPKVLQFRQLDPQQAPAAVRQWVENSRHQESAASRTVGQKTYLLVTRGEKPTGGYGVAITRVEDRGREVLVTVHYTEPSGMVTQALTYPLILVEIPKVDKPVRFVGENGQAVPQLPGGAELPPVVQGSSGIKLHAVKKSSDTVVLTGIVNASGGARVSYVVKEPWGKTIKSGSITPNHTGQLWTPFELSLSRADFGSNDRLSVTISRRDANGKHESLVMSIYRASFTR